MNAVHHLPGEVLSAYIDEELTAPERREAEDHLGHCADCQDRLEGLRRVAGGLRSLERVAPPAMLEHGLRRHLAIDAKERGLRGRLEERSLAPRRLPTHFGLVFATVLAFAVILYLFAQALDVRQNGSIGAVGAEFEGARPAVAFERDGALWRQERVLGEPARIVEVESEEGRRLLADLPALLALIEGSEGVVLEIDGEVVLIRSRRSAP
ncbi:MAG TPA: zf-HC2 domain-containing protein [Thermoanaerobaculia bacterium]|nr:zf-HC2 domain-containing protein [Thermoanaerobaculia bacterium]